jgi:hypothetical protein
MEKVSNRFKMNLSINNAMQARMRTSLKKQLTVVATDSFLAHVARALAADESVAFQPHKLRVLSVAVRP